MCPNVIVLYFPYYYFFYSITVWKLGWITFVFVRPQDLTDITTMSLFDQAAVSPGMINSAMICFSSYITTCFLHCLYKKGYGPMGIAFIYLPASTYKKTEMESLWPCIPEDLIANWRASGVRLCEVQWYNWWVEVSILNGGQNYRWCFTASLY